MSTTENKKLVAEELAKPRNAGTSKAIADKIDGCTILDPHPVAPKHAAGWNDAIEMVKLSIEPNLKNLELAEAMPPSESVLDSLEAAKRQAEQRIAELYKKAKAFAKNGYPANEQDCLREIKGIEFVLAILPTQAKQRASKGRGDE